MHNCFSFCHFTIYVFILLTPIMNSIQHRLVHLQMGGLFDYVLTKLHIDQINVNSKLCRNHFPNSILFPSVLFRKQCMASHSNTSPSSSRRENENASHLRKSVVDNTGYGPGLATSTIQFIICWLFTIKDRCKKCVFNKRIIKVCVSCCWRCPWTSAPSAAHLTVSLYLCSSGSNAEASRGLLKGALSA